MIFTFVIMFVEVGGLINTERKLLINIVLFVIDRSKLHGKRKRVVMNVN